MAPCKVGRSTCKTPCQKALCDYILASDWADLLALPLSLPLLLLLLPAFFAMPLLLSLQIYLAVSWLSDATSGK